MLHLYLEHRKLTLLVFLNLTASHSQKMRKKIKLVYYDTPVVGVTEIVVDKVFLEVVTKISAIRLSLYLLTSQCFLFVRRSMVYFACLVSKT